MSAILQSGKGKRIRAAAKDVKVAAPVLNKRGTREKRDKRMKKDGGLSLFSRNYFAETSERVEKIISTLALSIESLQESEFEAFERTIDELMAEERSQFAHSLMPNCGRVITAEELKALGDDYKPVKREYELVESSVEEQCESRKIVRRTVKRKKMN